MILPPRPEHRILCGVPRARAEHRILCGVPPPSTRDGTPHIMRCSVPVDPGRNTAYYAVFRFMPPQRSAPCPLSPCRSRAVHVQLTPFSPFAMATHPGQARSHAGQKPFRKLRQNRRQARSHSNWVCTAYCVCRGQILQPTPRSNFQLPGLLLPTPVTQLSTPKAQLSTPRANFQLPGPNFQFPGPNFQFPGPNFQLEVGSWELTVGPGN
jgi:hypothetical protein